jgi:hypothetical protein
MSNSGILICNMCSNSIQLAGYPKEEKKQMHFNTVHTYEKGR